MIKDSASSPRIVGLTGGLASGKSTVARMLRELGAQVIDADEVAREVVLPGRPAYQQIIATFGDGVLGPTDPATGKRPIDRARLADIVFTDEDARRKLNAITHPEVATESAARIAALSEKGVRLAIYEAPLIVENGLYKGLDGLIVVDLPEEDQVRRAVARGLSESQAQLRIRSQAGRDARREVATWIIDNSGSEPSTRKQVEAVWADLQSNRRPEKKAARRPSQKPGPKP